MNSYRLTIVLVLCLLVIGFFGVRQVTKGPLTASDYTLVIVQGDSAAAVAERLKEDGVIRSARLFRWYMQRHGLDRTLPQGEYPLSAPFTFSRIGAALATPAKGDERTIMIIPGSTIHTIAAQFEQAGIATAEEVYAVLGTPVTFGASAEGSLASRRDVGLLAEHPGGFSLEGYLLPETHRFFVDASLEDILARFAHDQAALFTDEVRADIAARGRTIHEILTMASLIEREVRGDTDRALVSDIFWRRFAAGWGMQADSTVHYIFGTDGTFFTTAAQRASQNAWNTYAHAGLPPGPISMPSTSSIMAAIYPKANTDWFFLTTHQGEVKYGETLDEHNQNRRRYLQ